MAADMERQLLEHYNLKTLYPSEWPPEKDDAEDSEEDAQPAQNSSSIQRRRSRYSVLERSGVRSSKVPGTEKTKDGVDTLVQKDEVDPLGNASSVVNVLRARGLPVEDDMKLRVCLQYRAALLCV